MREKRKGYPAVVSIGYRTNKKEKGKIMGLKPVIVKNNEELEKIGKNEVAVLEKIGKKKKIEIAKFAISRGIKFANFNPKKFMKGIEKIKNEN